MCITYILIIYVLYLYNTGIAPVERFIMDKGVNAQDPGRLSKKELENLGKQLPVSLYRLMALLSEGPKSGYDISTEVENEDLASWRDSFGNIYPNLKKLVELGIAEKMRDDFKGRKRIYYSLTATGRELLNSWLRAPAQRTPIKMELLFKLRFGYKLGIDAMLDHLLEYRDFCARNHPMFEKWYSEVRDSDESGLEHEMNRLTSDFWYRFTKSLLEWSEDTVKRLEQYQ